MENFNADSQNSSDTEEAKDIFSLPGQALLSSCYIDPSFKDFIYEKPISFDARQDITSYPFVGQSGEFSYGISFCPLLVSFTISSYWF